MTPECDDDGSVAKIRQQPGACVASVRHPESNAEGIQRDWRLSAGCRYVAHRGRRVSSVEVRSAPLRQDDARADDTGTKMRGGVKRYTVTVVGP